MHDVAKEINGYYLADVFDKKTNKQVGKKGDLCTNFVTLQDDGTTSSGNWLYSGSYTMKDGKEVNMMARRGKRIPRDSVSIPPGHGPGRLTGGSSTTAHPLIPTAILGTPTAPSSNGTR